MNNYLHFRQKNLGYRILAVFVCFTFIAATLTPPQYAHAQVAPTAGTVLNLPFPGSMIQSTDAFTPVSLWGITLDPQDPFKFYFTLDKGHTGLSGEDLEAEATQLAKYFLAALTVPEEEMWVNLSPYEKNRIIPQSFGDTEMGRDLLAQDYLLKQLTASLMYPEEDIGENFWERIYAKAYEKYGTTDIPMDTFHKVWIVPERARVVEEGNSAYIVDSYLKVMLEDDYVAAQHNRGASLVTRDSEIKSNLKRATRHERLATNLIREIIIPEIEREVNEGATFAKLRQIYQSMILATWYKIRMEESLLGQIYVDQNKTKGVDTHDKKINQKIYNQYIAAFQEGVYDYIKEDYDPITQTIVPRKYFSGGFSGKLRNFLIIMSATAAISAGIIFSNLGISNAGTFDSPGKETVAVSLVSTSNKGPSTIRDRNNEIRKKRHSNKTTVVQKKETLKKPQEQSNPIKNLTWQFNDSLNEITKNKKQVSSTTVIQPNDPLTPLADNKITPETKTDDNQEISKPKVTVVDEPQDNNLNESNEIKVTETSIKQSNETTEQPSISDVDTTTEQNVQTTQNDTLEIQPLSIETDTTKEEKSSSGSDIQITETIKEPTTSTQELVNQFKKDISGNIDIEENKLAAIPIAQHLKDNPTDWDEFANMVLTDPDYDTITKILPNLYSVVDFDKLEILLKNLSESLYGYWNSVLQNKATKILEDLQQKEFDRIINNFVSTIINGELNDYDTHEYPLIAFVKKHRFLYPKMQDTLSNYDNQAVRKIYQQDILPEFENSAIKTIKNKVPENVDNKASQFIKERLPGDEVESINIDINNLMPSGGVGETLLTNYLKEKGIYLISLLLGVGSLGFFILIWGKKWISEFFMKRTSVNSTTSRNINKTSNKQMQINPIKTNFPPNNSPKSIEDPNNAPTFLNTIQRKPSWIIDVPSSIYDVQMKLSQKNIKLKNDLLNIIVNVAKPTRSDLNTVKAIKIAQKLDFHIASDVLYYLILREGDSDEIKNVFKGIAKIARFILEESKIEKTYFDSLLKGTVNESARGITPEMITVWINNLTSSDVKINHEAADHLIEVVAGMTTESSTTLLPQEKISQIIANLNTHSPGTVFYSSMVLRALLYKSIYVIKQLQNNKNEKTNLVLNDAIDQIEIIQTRGHNAIVNDKNTMPLRLPFLNGYPSELKKVISMEKLRKSNIRNRAVTNRLDEVVKHADDLAVDIAMHVNQDEELGYGGINLDRAMMDFVIERDAEGMPLPVSQQPVEHIRMNLEGFRPIVEIAPLILPAFLSLLDQNAPNTHPNQDELSALSPVDKKNLINSAAF